MTEVSMNVKSLCVFCFSEAENASTSKEILFKTEEYWPYIQPSGWESYKETPPQILPTCRSCSEKIEKVAKCHREIVELKRKLDAVRKLLDKVVGNVRKAMGKVTTTTCQVLEVTKKKKKMPLRSKSVKRSFHEIVASYIIPIPGAEKSVSTSSFHAKTGNDITNKRVKVEQSSSSSAPSGDAKAIKNETVNKLEESVPNVVSDSEQRSIKHTLASSSSSASKSVSDVEEDELVTYSPLVDEDEHDPDFKLEESSSESEYDAPCDPETSQDLKDPLELDQEESVPSKPIRLCPSTPSNRHGVRICVICGSSHTLADLYKHMKSHVGDFAFQCSGCSVTFPSRLSHAYYKYNHRTSCKCEISVHIDCQLCDKKVRLGGAFRHFESHETSEKNYTCPMPSCEKGFTWKQTLELHLGHHEHLKAKRIKKSGESSWNFRQCEICGEKLSMSLSVLKEHMESHVGEYAFQCPQEKCQLTFASRYSLKCLGHRYNEICELDLPKICEKCNEEFDHFRNLKAHVQRHEIAKEKNFTCPVRNCGKGFTIKQSLEFHIGSHAFRKSLQRCTVCKLKMTPDKMLNHLRNVHGCGAGEIINCGYCPLVFHTHENYMEHLMRHVKNRSDVKCHLCSNQNQNSETYRLGASLRRHYFKEHQIGKEYICESENCNFTAYTIYTLRHHKLQVHEGRCLRICQICEDKPKFTSAAGLASHRIKVHGKEKFKCGFADCTESFVTKSALHQHEKRVHRGVEMKSKQYPCSQCQMVFKSKEGLVHHEELQHSDSSNKEGYQCENCGKSQRTTIAHKKHVKRCNATFVCETCGKAFKDRSRLEEHKRVHTGERPYLCKLCGQGFRQSSVLETHMRIHTGERPYLCKLCGLSFRQQSSWYNHNKAHERKGDKFMPKGTFERTPKTD